MQWALILETVMPLNQHTMSEPTLKPNYLLFNLWVFLEDRLSQTGDLSFKTVGPCEAPFLEKLSQHRELTSGHPS